MDGNDSYVRIFNLRYDSAFALQETRAEAVRSPVNQQQARVNRDSIAKCLYSKYFELLVEELNHRLAPPSAGELEASRSISLLDIYGFEVGHAVSLKQPQFSTYKMQIKSKTFVADNNLARIMPIPRKIK